MEIHFHSHRLYFSIISIFKTSPSDLKRMDKERTKLVLPKVIEESTRIKTFAQNKNSTIYTK